MLTTNGSNQMMVDMKDTTYCTRYKQCPRAATNKTIIDDGTFGACHVRSRCLTIAVNIVNNWSIELDDTSVNAKIFATEPTISLGLWTLSYEWAKSTKDIICISNDSSKTYSIPVCNLQSITKADLNKYKNKKWTTFN
ncbi:unnamed protein product [Rotaria sp. Silwood2]|nr:unnamed protein product [Rotaria sp. Silwood2]CAF3248336.1 unnamed protein product [Rotaria sp. Silwood2]CAF4201134.1 unnamed protein product [Rotaria sp. Silwood2]